MISNDFRFNEKHRLSYCSTGFLNGVEKIHLDVSNIRKDFKIFQ
jgi:hypothetical protein